MELDRRGFLAGMGACAGLAWLQGCRKPAALVPVVESAAEPFRMIEVGGSHRELGRQLGEALRGEIQAVLELAGEDYAHILAAARGEQSANMAAFQQSVEARVPGLLEELQGMAEGCNRPWADLFAWNCRSELDVLSPQDEECSTVGLGSEGAFLLAHNEDGSASYRDRMCVVRVSPPSGVRFASLVYPGTLPGNGPGLNARGVLQCTNFIAPQAVADGIPRYFVGRSICEAGSLDEAIALATVQRRAFPWHHNLGSLSEGRLVSLETWPGRRSLQEIRGLHLHTNHLVHQDMLDLLEDRSYYARSSGPRWEALQRGVAQGAPQSREDMLALLADRSGQPCRLCRHPGDEVPGVTLATAFFHSPELQMELLEAAPCFGRSQIVRI